MGRISLQPHDAVSGGLARVDTLRSKGLVETRGGDRSMWFVLYPKKIQRGGEREGERENGGFCI